MTRDGVVYELFLTNLPPTAFTAADVVALYLYRGSFETALADDDEAGATPCSRRRQASLEVQMTWPVD